MQGFGIMQKTCSIKVHWGTEYFISNTVSMKPFFECEKMTSDNLSLICYPVQLLTKSLYYFLYTKNLIFLVTVLL